MNLNKLYPKQAELDEYIGESKGIKMEDYKTERVLALQVEFNELLNELPFLFKYWSNKKMNRDKAIEEYVDFLHFILSIGNDHGFTNYEQKELSEHIDMKVLAFGIANVISRIGIKVSQGDKVWESEYYNLLDHFLLFGGKLGFTKNEVITHYELKHAENYNRQANRY